MSPMVTVLVGLRGCTMDMVSCECMMLRRDLLPEKLAQAKQGHAAEV
jgi:hypothetical protein